MEEILKTLSKDEKSYLYWVPRGAGYWYEKSEGYSRDNETEYKKLLNLGLIEVDKTSHLHTVSLTEKGRQLERLIKKEREANLASRK